MKTKSLIGTLLTEDRSLVDGLDVKNRDSIFLSLIETKNNQIRFLLFGIALLMPWNTTLATMDYFIEIYPNYKPSFLFLLAVTIPMLLM